MEETRLEIWKFLFELCFRLDQLVLKTHFLSKGTEMSEEIGPKEVCWDFITRKTKALPKEEKKSP